MKIEIGESLFYSWLRHEKECQIVQTNWKTSPQWTLLHEDKLEEIKFITDHYFKEKYGYDIYKKTCALSFQYNIPEYFCTMKSLLEQQVKNIRFYVPANAEQCKCKGQDRDGNTAMLVLKYHCSYCEYMSVLVRLFGTAE